MSRFVQLLMFFLPLLCSGQPGTLRFEHLGIPDGFSSDEFYGAALDARGFAWFGTTAGLNFYDGHSVTVYRHNENDPKSIPGKSVGDIVFDDAGNLWAATSDGLAVFDQNTRTFTNFRFGALNDGQHWVHRLMRTRANKLWLSCVDGLVLFDPQTRKAEKIISISDTINGQAVHMHAAFDAIVESKDGSIWAGNIKGLWHVFPASGKYSRVKLPLSGIGNTTAQTDNCIISILEDDDQSLWLGCWGSALRHYDPKTGSAQTWLYATGKNYGYGNIISKIIRKRNDDPSLLWFSTIDNGVGVFNTKTQTFTLYPHEDGNPYSLRTNDCKSLYEDEAGIIWVLTAKGLEKYDPYANLFSLCDVKIDAADKAASHFIYQSVSDKTDPQGHRAWLGMDDDGIVLYDFSQKKILRHYKDFLFPVHETKSNHSLVRCLIQDSRNRIWFGNEYGLYLLDTMTGKVRWFRPEGDGVNRFYGDFVSGIEEDKNGKLWLACRGGLFRFDPGAEKFEKFAPVVSSPFQADDNRINFISIDAQQQIWLFTESRQFGKFDPLTGAFVSCSSWMNARAVYDMRCDSAGHILLSDVRGLFIADPATKSVRIYNSSNGLADDHVYSALRDKQGRIWAATRNGLSVIDLTKQSVHNYREDDGLQRNFLDCGLTLLDNGMMVIGGDRSVEIFDPLKMKPNPYSRQTIITRFSVPGKEINFDPDSVQHTPVEISYTQNILTFEFAAPDYSHQKETHYYYMLKGFDQGWIDAGTKTSATYTNLDGGDYIFLVKSANADGLMNETPATFRLYVIPPFWKTIWFRILSVFLGLFIVLLVYFYNIRRIRREEKQKTEFNRRVADAELKALRAQMNPHFIFNCMNTIDALVMKKNYSEASAFLNKFSRLIRMVLEHSIHRLVTIERDMQALKLYVALEQQRFSDQFEAVFEIDDELSDGHFRIPPLLLQPYVENAILHGLRHKEGKGLLRIRLFIDADQLVCIIEDNGVGREKSAAIKSQNHPGHQSHGMKVTSERIEIFNFTHAQKAAVSVTDLQDASGQASGTRVIIRLPLLNE